MNKLSFFGAAAVSAMLLISTGVAAQTTVYKGYDANTSSTPAAATNPNSSAASALFQANLSGTSTESFESFKTGATPPLSLSFTGSAGTLSATLNGNGDVASATRAAPTSSGQFATDGNKYYEATSTSFSITFGSAIAAFGFFSTDIESDLQVTLAHASGPSEAFSYATLFGTSTSTPSGSVNFLGLINTANPFTSVAFAPGSNSSGDIFAFDQMTIGDKLQVVTPPTVGAVPEPGTWSLMILGFGIVGFGLRGAAKRSEKKFDAKIKQIAAGAIA